MPFRRRFTRLAMAALVLFTAALSVGLTSPADGLFTVDIRPVFLEMDPAAVAESRARALGVDIDVKFGSIHMHVGWSAISPRRRQP